MGGITSGTGIFSGIDSASIIEKLLAIEARPRDLAQARIAQLQLQQTGYLDLNSRLSALRDAAKAFRENKTFKTRSATSSDEDVMTASADTTAPNGTYQFIVDRLVTTRQLLSRGFASATGSAMGATSFTFESEAARLDRDVSLSELNNGSGVERGKIVITDTSGASATVDLSRATSVGDVLDTINHNGTARVTAIVRDGKLVIQDNAAGTGALRVDNASGYNTATSLGIAGTGLLGELSGSTVYALNGNTSLSTLNDGRGVNIRSTVGVGTAVWNFKVNVSGADVLVNIGDVYENQTTGGVTTAVKTQGAATTAQQVVDRINTALQGAGQTDVSASIDATNGRLVIRDASGLRTITVSENPTLNSTTAADLGIAGSATGVLNGKRVLAGLNTTLLRGLNGGAGITGDGKLDITTRDGHNYAIQLDTTNSSLESVIRQVSQETSGRIRLSLNAKGTGLDVTDTTTGPGNLIIVGTTGEDSAASLHISTGASGVASNTLSTGNLQRQYISRATTLASLNSGKGVGTGTFRITDSTGRSETVTIGTDMTNVGEVIDLINSRGLKVKASINAKGDGIQIAEDNTSSPAGTVKIKVEDTSGSVAKAFNLAGTAADVGASNKLDGSFEETVTFSAADSLQQVIDKINLAGVGVGAALVRDGNGPTPFRLSLTSSTTGSAGRFILDTGTFDLASSVLEQGRDALVFYGSTDPARAIAVSSSSNTVDSLLPGVRIDLKRTSSDPITLTVATDTEAITTAVNVFVKTFNTLIGRIDTQTSYDQASNKGGPLLGDSTALDIRSQLFSVLQSAGQNTTGRFSNLTQVGIKIGAGGTIDLDETLFRQALEQDPSSVESLFAARTQVQDNEIEVDGLPGVTVRNPNAGSTFSSLGIMGQFEQLVTRYIDTTTGALTSRSKGLDDQIKLQKDRVDAFNVRLSQRQDILQRQFAAMESTIGKLQTQQASLGSIG